MDTTPFRELASSPHQDPRQWVSVGIVIPDPSASQRSVRFNDASGNPLPHGVLVDVKLQPSGVECVCRVSHATAEAGGGEYHPFVAGDEVVVAIPEGDELAGGIILGRLNQLYDTFPRVVGGQDITKNNVAFKRLTAPYVLESGTAITLTCANTGAYLTIDPQGRVMLTSGDLAQLLMTPDAVSLQLSGLAAGFQLDASKKQASVIAGGTSLVLDDQQSMLQTAGQFSLNTGGNTAANHAISVEAFLNILFNLIPNIGIGTVPLTPVQIAAAVTAAAATPLNPIIAEALTAALMIPKTFPDPGVGSPGTLID